jgi:diguanylate cyclase (GGDEF)-like protein
MMRSPQDVTVLEHPSWWTPAHALVLVSLAFTATLLVLVWVVVLRKRVERQATLLKESEERFRHMAQHDALTGLATRLVLQDRLDVALESARRYGAGLALFMVDLDQFKEINDRYGHHMGDEVLRVTADRLTAIVRKSDTVARMGGDEFVVLLNEQGDAQHAAAVAEKIVASLAVPIPFEGRMVEVSVSVGACTASAGDLDAEALMKGADQAMYQAKQQGRNCYRVFTPGIPTSPTD